MPDPASLATIFAGAGSGVNAIGQFTQGRSQNRRAQGMMQTEPGFLENYLRSQFNTGQDGMMQMARGNGMGEPFDISQLTGALEPIRQRQLDEAIASTRSASPGLGQRFGSAQMRSEQGTALQHLQNISAQDSALMLQGQQGQQQMMAQRELGFLQLLAQAEQARRSGNFQALGGFAAPQNFGQPGIDFGSILLLQNLMKPAQTPAQLALAAKGRV